MNTLSLARRLGELLQVRGWMVATAESCTGGGIAAAITDIPGSSAWFDRGFVTYSNQAKCEMLGVAEASLREHGAVSAAVVEAMAGGALARSSADIAVAVSGVAGPDGGSAEKPVGTVWIAWASRNGRARSAKFLFSGDRMAVREATIIAAMEGIIADIS